MILVDTNVLSEFGYRRPDPTAMAWLRDQDGLLYLSTITIAELIFGVERMRDKSRRNWLRRLYTKLIRAFDDRVLPFDAEAAMKAGELRAIQERTGRQLSFQDAQIAAIAMVHGATLATRNVGDFEITGLAVINPFE